MDTPGTRDDRLEHPPPELPQRFLDAVQNVNAPRDQLRVTPVPFLVEPVDLPLGNALFQSQIERAPPLFEGNPAEELFREFNTGLLEKLPRCLKIDFLRVHEDAVVVPEYRPDHWSPISEIKGRPHIAGGRPFLPYFPLIRNRRINLCRTS